MFWNFNLMFFLAHLIWKVSLDTIFLLIWFGIHFTLILFWTQYVKTTLKIDCTCMSNIKRKYAFIFTLKTIITTWTWAQTMWYHTGLIYQTGRPKFTSTTSSSWRLFRNQMDLALKSIFIFYLVTWVILWHYLA